MVCNFSNRERSHNALILPVPKICRILHGIIQNIIIVYPFIVATNTIQSTSGAPLRLPLRVGIDCLQLRCVVDLHCIPVEIFPNARRHCLPTVSANLKSQRITNRSQPGLHVFCYRIGELIFTIQFEPLCCPCQSLTIRRRHCRLLFSSFARILPRAPTACLRHLHTSSYVTYDVIFFKDSINVSHLRLLAE
jgi:hypothetical protein